jgi:hypothetical protein
MHEEVTGDGDERLQAAGEELVEGEDTEEERRGWRRKREREKGGRGEKVEEESDKRSIWKRMRESGKGGTGKNKEDSGFILK